MTQFISVIIPKRCRDVPMWLIERVPPRKKPNLIHMIKAKLRTKPFQLQRSTHNLLSLNPIRAEQ
jgi:hypothetical protein